MEIASTLWFIGEKIAVFFLVGVGGLEPPASRPPGARASQLRHTPDILPKGPTEWANQSSPFEYQVGVCTLDPRVQDDVRLPL